MSFEAAWAPDGAYCIQRTRDGRPMDEVLKECPGRLAKAARRDLGQGDQCTILRPGRGLGAFLLRNRSLDRP